MAGYLGRVIQLIKPFASLGERVLNNGTQLIGSATHIAPEAWLHIVYPPLTLSDVLHLESTVGKTIPPVFCNFLQNCNGLYLFSGRLSIDGLRKSFSRSGDDAWQPFSIFTPNIEERPKHSKPSFFFIGGYGSDGSLLYIDDSDLRVYRCTSKSAKPLSSWPSFEVMLESEALRLRELFDTHGRQIDPNLPTIPPLMRI